MSDKIKDALSKLDTGNDEHWTADGLPKIEALGIDGVKRRDVTDAAPHFTRDNPAIATPAETKQEAEKAAEPTLEEQRDILKEKIDVLAKAAHEANQALNAELRKLDIVETALSRGMGSQPSNQGAMEYLAFQRKLREEQAR